MMKIVEAVAQSARSAEAIAVALANEEDSGAVHASHEVALCVLM